LLLDEVAAHLDRRRRAALFDEIEALGLQAFLTGTDEHLFEDLQGRAQGVRVDASGLAILDTQ
jgi:DNA replication and repair protein RecF